MLHEGVIYRHIVLTVPEVLRQTFYDDAELLGPFMRIANKCLDDFFSCVSRKSLKGGYIVVLQTHGRNGQYNPHLHIIATSGGLDEEGQKWVPLNYLPYHVLHKKWQWYLLEMLREQLDTDEIDRLVDYCYKRYPKGFVANVQTGDVPARYKSLAKYRNCSTPPYFQTLARSKKGSNGRKCLFDGIKGSHSLPLASIDH
jgi:hypothetical protein